MEKLTHARSEQGGKMRAEYGKQILKELSMRIDNELERKFYEIVPMFETP